MEQSNQKISRQVNRYLQGAIPDSHCFFTTMLPTRVRSRFTELEKFQEKIYQVMGELTSDEMKSPSPTRDTSLQCTRRDLRVLEQLQYDRRYESNIGVVQLRQFILEMAWKRYQVRSKLS